MDETMAKRSRIVILLLATVIPQLCAAVSSTGGPAGFNIFDNYCNRLYMQSTTTDATIWIDGGLESFTQWRSNNSLLTYNAIPPMYNGTNPYLIEVPMNYTWDWKGNITEIAINMSSPAPSSGTSPPQVYQGALFQGLASDPRIWLYGGTYSWLGQAFSWFLYPNSQHYALWSYDTSSNVWQQYDISETAPYRPSHGYAAEASDLGLGFYFNGKIDNGSAAETVNMGTEVVFLEGMVVTNLTAPDARNISTSPVTQGSPRAGGRAHRVPGYGGQGVLVFIGGGEKSVLDHSSDGYGSLLPMDQILIFDIASLYSKKENATDSAWYNQTATGTIPEPRSDFCLVGVPAPDNSSYSIFLYGGRNQTTAFDDIYALTLPAFVWTQVYFDGASPRYGHDCQLLTGRQMITIGGAKTEKLDDCDWEVKGIAVYDISQNEWGSVYNSKLTNYTVPKAVVSAIGGSPTGGAVATSPADGWTSPALAKAFGQSVGGTKSSGHKLSGGAIAGIVVGSVAFVAICVCAVFYYYAAVAPKRQWNKRSKSNKHNPVEADATTNAIHEKEGESRFAHEVKGDEQHVPELAGAQHAVELPAEEIHVEPRAIIGQT